VKQNLTPITSLTNNKNHKLSSEQIHKTQTWLACQGMKLARLSSLKYTPLHRHNLGSGLRHQWLLNSSFSIFVHTFSSSMEKLFFKIQKWGFQCVTRMGGNGEC